ncbi:MAG: SUMF1/EgtB/PvdO family nonheme iron enzyme [Saprospirales bacterium]|nr:SUMF1/EgtB/PvdO family nonheme iron enzyme [Saprospirales bacterium]
MKIINIPIVFVPAAAVIVKVCFVALLLGLRSGIAIAQTTPDSIFLVHFTFVKGGTFQMGDVMDDKIETNEIVHAVTISDFYLSKYEVTFGEYDVFCEATRRTMPNDEGWGRGQRLAIYISWYDAIEYCNWLSEQQSRIPYYVIDKSRIDSSNTNTSFNQKWTVTRDTSANGYRLPTEAEWEYAAREGGKKMRFGNGRDTIDPVEVNFDSREIYKKPFSIVGQYYGKTVLVNELSANALGLYNMSGNVWEWCWDWYGSDYYTQSKGIHNPIGAESGKYRSLRGGGWGDMPTVCRAVFRGGYPPFSWGSSFGFRLACSFQ